MKIEVLTADRPRDKFVCDHPEITAYFQKRALKDHEAYKVRIRVAVYEGKPDPIGFHSLVGGALEPNAIARLTKKFGSKRDVPVVYLAAVAVQSHECKKGIGALLMFDAFERVIEIADRAGMGCMTLDAIDEEKARWYEKLGFERFGVQEDGRIKMFIPLATIREALAG